MDYLPNTDKQRDAMLKDIGVSSLDDLFSQLIPATLKNHKLDLPPALDPIALEKKLNDIGDLNTGTDKICFLGGGAYDRYSPAVVEELLWRSEFYTAYTPYQAERSQGSLISIYEFQTLMGELMGLPISNASLYDAPAALWEAVSIGWRSTKMKRKQFLLAPDLNPRYRDVIACYAKNLGLDLVTLPAKNGTVDIEESLKINFETAAVIVTQNPGYYGHIQDYTDLNKKSGEQKCVPIMAADPLAMGILKTPGDMGAELAIGEGQSLGLPLGYGGPYLGIITCAKKHLRKLPGRLSGKTLDKEGNTGWVLTLQAREQHIKREKATSSVCTNQGLLALAASIYLTYLGPEGLKEVAMANVKKTQELRNLLKNIEGLSFAHEGPFFNEFVYKIEGDEDKFLKQMEEKGFLAGIKTEEGILVAVTEKRTQDELKAYADAVKEALGAEKSTVGVKSL